MDGTEVIVPVSTSELLASDGTLVGVPTDIGTVEAATLTLEATGVLRRPGKLLEFDIVRDSRDVKLLDELLENDPDMEILGVMLPEELLVLNSAGIMLVLLETDTEREEVGATVEVKLMTWLKFDDGLDELRMPVGLHSAEKALERIWSG